jgi:hypothetical protein
MKRVGVADDAFDISAGEKRNAAPFDGDPFDSVENKRRGGFWVVEDQIYPPVFFL